MPLGEKKKKQLLQRLTHSMELDFVEDEFDDPAEMLQFLLEVASERLVVRPEILSAIAWELDEIDESAEVVFGYLEALVDHPNWSVWRNNPGWSWSSESAFDRLVEVGLGTRHLDGMPATFRAQASCALYLADKIAFDELGSDAKLAFARATLSVDYDDEYWQALAAKTDPAELQRLRREAAASLSTPYVDWTQVEPVLPDFEEEELAFVVHNIWSSVDVLNPHMGPDPTPPEAPVRALEGVATDEGFECVARAVVALAIEHGSEEIGVERHAAGLASFGLPILPHLVEALDDAPVEAAILLANALGKTGFEEAERALQELVDKDRRKTVRQTANEALQGFVRRSDANDGPSTRIDELAAEYETLRNDELDQAIAALKKGGDHKALRPFVDKHGCAALIPIRQWYYEDPTHYPAQSAYHALIPGHSTDGYWLRIERMARVADLPGYQVTSLAKKLKYFEVEAARPALRHYLRGEPHHAADLLWGLVKTAQPNDLDHFIAAMEDSRKTMREPGRLGAQEIADEARVAVTELLAASKADVRAEAARFFEAVGNTRDTETLKAALESERSKKVKAALASAIEAIGESAFDDLDEASVVEQWEAEAQAVPDFLAGIDLPLQLCSSSTLGEDAVMGWVARLRNENDEATDPFNRESRQFLSDPSADATGRAIFEAWVAGGEPADQKWAVFQLAFNASAATLDRTVHDLDERATTNPRQAAWFIEMLRRHGSDRAAAWLNHYRQNSVQPSVMLAASEAWDDLIGQHDEPGDFERRVDPFVAARSAEWRAIERGDVDALVRGVERAMIEGRVWSSDEWTAKLESEPFERALEGIVLRSADTLCQVTEGKILDAAMDALEPVRGDVAVAHPIDMTDEERATWGQWKASFEAMETFEQLSRPVFHPADGVEVTLERVRLAGLSRLGFKHVTSSEWSYEAFRNFAGHGVTAHVHHDGFLITDPTHHGREKVDARLAFADVHGTQLSPVEVNPRIFSEARYALARVAR